MNPIIENILDRMLSQFNIRKINNKYYYWNEHPYFTLYHYVPFNMADILKLLELPEDIGCDIIYAAHVLAASPYFSKRIIRTKKHEIRSFLGILNDCNIFVGNKPRKKINVIKAFKNNLKVDLTTIVNLDSINRDKVRSKLNGKLIKDWLNYNNKRYVDCDYHINKWKEFMNLDDRQFYHYIIKSSAKSIKNSFILYHMFKDVNRRIYKDEIFYNESI